jgi:hypothetical protein
MCDPPYQVLVLRVKTGSLHRLFDLSRASFEGTAAWLPSSNTLSRIQISAMANNDSSGDEESDRRIYRLEGPKSWDPYHFPGSITKVQFL